MSFAEALLADRAGEIEVAAKAYECLLQDGCISATILLNLSLLYWQATDPGIASGRHLSPEFYATAGRRLHELLEEAEAKFPQNTAVRFWKRYIAWAELGDPLSRDECLKWLGEDPANLLPSMWIFAESQGEEAAVEAKSLLVKCREDGTMGARYVVSVIEGVLRRMRGGQ